MIFKFNKHSNMSVPGSILIHDGRRSASPDRRVTFGNVERYDIMTSNELKNNIYVKRDIMANNLKTPTGTYIMTRLDDRIRKAIMLGFAETPGSVGFTSRRCFAELFCILN